MTKLRADQITEMAVLRERGWSMARLAARYGVTPGAIHYRCLKAGALSPRSRPIREAGKRATNAFGFGGRVRHFTAEEDQRLLALARAGQKTEAIATVMNRAPTSVRIRLLTLELKANMA